MTHRYWSHLYQINKSNSETFINKMSFQSVYARGSDGIGGYDLKDGADKSICL